MAGSAAEQAAWVERVLGIRPQGPPGADAAAMRAWRDARDAAVGTLRTLAEHIGTLDHPSRDNAIVLLRAIAANLTAAPESAQQQRELRRYLETDDIVAEAEEPNGFGMVVSLRRPLLAALARLEAG